MIFFVFSFFLQMLNKVLEENERAKAQFLDEYEKLRTLNSDREQQLLNDFEWKLREVELKCKRKLEQKDIVNEEKIQSIRDQNDNELKRYEEQFKEVRIDVVPASISILKRRANWTYL